MQSKFTLESFKESFVWKVNDSGTRQIKEPVLSDSEEPVLTPRYNSAHTSGMAEVAASKSTISIKTYPFVSTLLIITR